MLRNSARIALLFLLLFSCSWLYIRSASILQTSFGPSAIYSTHRKNKEIYQSLFLTANQCMVAFPELNREIKNAIVQGPFVLKKLRDETHGLVQGRIKDGKVRCLKNFQTTCS